MSAAGLEGALRAIGLDTEIDADGAVAIMRLRCGTAAPEVSALASAETRRMLVSLAADHGFRTLSLELADVPAVSRESGERGVAD